MIQYNYLSNCTLEEKRGQGKFLRNLCTFLDFGFWTTANRCRIKLLFLFLFFSSQSLKIFGFTKAKQVSFLDVSEPLMCLYALVVSKTGIIIHNVS